MSTLLNNLKITRKLLGAFGLLLLVTLTLAGFALTGVRTVNGASSDIVENWLPSLQKAGEIATLLTDHRRIIFAHVISTDNADMDRYEKELAETTAQLAKALRDYEPMIILDEERRLHGQITKAVKVYLSEAEKVIILSRRNENDQAREVLLGESRTAFYAAKSDAARLVQVNADEAARLQRSATSVYWNTLIVVSLSAALAVVLTVVFAWGLRAAIARPITDISDAMSKLADGDKAVAIPGTDRGDELGGMAQAVQVFKDNMIRADQMTAEQERQRAGGGFRTASENPFHGWLLKKSAYKNNPS